jgi:predicted dehydrogenase
MLLTLLHLHYPTTNALKLPSTRQACFYRKPISNTLAEAEEIIALAKEYNVKGQGTCGAIIPHLLPKK